MANDTTRKKRVPDSISIDEIDLAVLGTQMLGDIADALDVKPDEDGCRTHGMTLAAVTSLQRELAESRQHAKEARQALTSIRGAVGVDLGTRRASNEAPVEVNTELYRTKILEAIAALKSRASLTPLDDPSVRGVLVDDGEPRQLRPGQMGVVGLAVYQHPAFSDGPSASARWQPVKLRPASEFGVASERSEARGKALLQIAAKLNVKLPPNENCVPLVPEIIKAIDQLVAARGEPGLKNLPEGARVIMPCCETDPGYKVSHLDGWWLLLDPALYAIPDQGERIKELEAEVERLTETPTILAERARIIEAMRFHEAAVADAERLRKAIGEAAYTLATGGFAGAIAAQQMLLAALTPSPAAGEKSCQQPENTRTAPNAPASSQATRNSAESANDASDNSPSSESKTSGTTKTSTTTPPTCEPSPAAKADTQGNAQHHSEGAKIPDGGSGSPAAESEVPTTRKREPRTYKEELEWRLAACEERCKELEGGIERHKEETIRALTTTGNRVPWQGDLDLWSLLAPKAGGEDAGYDYVTIPTRPEPTK